ncbi:iron ABC transporter permease [Mangrovactinospora gilvigrisea]|uniref:Iron ABC transporter permease n=1 Tax=Mangrovactinospora gilvigrisea TaxID=1428644 RepID=A0A1J7BEE8_9ACTN|nr:iron ABC transporter permease [Mangrovactinospora gilvigrisea]OIV37051.1 iron ABC transporter permease [Mangrovactinospora gilvigrisea]
MSAPALAAPGGASAAPAPSRPRATRRRLLWVLAAVVLLALVTLLSLAVGARAIPPSHVIDAILHGGSSNDALVVRTQRLPRTIVGLVVGASLGVAGAVMQGITRNPIAEPGVLGISNGAAGGVVCAIVLFDVHSLTGYVWFGFAGALIAAICVYAVASAGPGGSTPVKLALSGAAFAALLGSVISGVMSTQAQALDEYRFWLVGSLGGRGWDVALQVLPFLGVGLVLVFAVARGLDALALGEDAARGLGQNVALVRGVGALGATVLTGSAVAAAGPIAFVGLVVPHAARRLVGTGHRWVLAMAALLGPAMLVVSDVIGRVLFPPSEVPAGVMTALMGVPVLVALVRGRKVIAS